MASKASPPPSAASWNKPARNAGRAGDPAVGQGGQPSAFSYQSQGASEATLFVPLSLRPSVPSPRLLSSPLRSGIIKRRGPRDARLDSIMPPLPSNQPGCRTLLRSVWCAIAGREVRPLSPRPRCESAPRVRLGRTHRDALRLLFLGRRVALRTAALPSAPNGLARWRGDAGSRQRAPYHGGALDSGALIGDERWDASPAPSFISHF